MAGGDQTFILEGIPNDILTTNIVNERELKVGLYDGFGNPISSFKGALDVHDADVHREVINQQFHQHTATSTTFAAAAPAGSTSITLTDPTGFAIGHYLHLEDGGIENPHPKIVNLVGSVVTLDRPLDFSFNIGDTIIRAIVNMNVLGTLASPQSFKVQPLSGQVMHITGILIEMTHGTAGDNGLFGDLTALTYGVVLRRYDGTTGTTATFTIWRTNSDIVTDVYDVTYSARSGGGGNYGTNARGTFANAGAIVYLDGTAGDYLEILIQDDLTSLNSFRIKAQGHYEGV